MNINVSGRINDWLHASGLVDEHLQDEAKKNPSRSPIRQFLFETVFRQAGVGLALFDGKDNLVDANLHLCKMLGVPRRELLGKRLNELTAPQGTALPKEIESISKIQLLPQGVDVNFATGDDTSVCLHLSAGFVDAPLSAPGYSVLVFQNTATQQPQQAEKQPHEDEVRFKNLLALSSDWCWEQDEEFRFTTITVADGNLEKLPCSNIIGHRRWEIPGLTALDGDFDAHKAMLEAHLPFRNFECFLSDEVTGIERYVSISGNPVFDDAGVFCGYRGVSRDFTDQQQKVEALTRFRTAIDTTTDGFYLIDRASMRFIDVNDTACRMLGYTREELLALGPADIATLNLEETKQNYDNLIAIAAESPQTLQRTESYHIQKNGSRLPVEITRRALRSGGRNIIVAVTRDLSQRKSTEEALRRSEMQFHELAKSIPEVFWMFNLEDHRYTYVSPAYQVIWGHPGESLLLDASTWKASIHTEDRERVAAASSKSRDGAYDIEYRIVRPDGNIRWIHDRAFPIKDEDGLVRRLSGIAEDVTEQKLAEEQFVRLAHYDAITELPNRVLFHDRVTRALGQAQRYGWVTALMFINLDRFKTVNDTLGHAFGDRLLKQIAERLLTSVRSADTVGRLGGDEFAIIISDVTDPQDASLVAQKILDVIGQPFYLDSYEMFVTASIGISLYPGDGGDIDMLMRNTDTALHRAKELGRNNYQFYTSEMNDKAQKKLSLENSLRRALEREEFRLYYQPKVDLRFNRICGVEALLRWQHPERGMVSPLEFISLLEETGLIVQAGEWALNTACKQICTWQTEGVRPVPIAVNVSARQFQEKGFSQKVCRIIHDAGIDPALIELEITESFLMRDPEEAVAALRVLNDAGISLAIDDFGTGYSSLAYLKRLPIQAIKIDRSFINDITTDPEDASITEAIIRIGLSLKLKTIAEGVETKEQLAFLHARGCDQIQGFLFSKPLPADKCTELMRKEYTLALDVPNADESENTVLVVDDDKIDLLLVCAQLEDEGYRVLTAESAAMAFKLLAEWRVGIVISDRSMPGMDGIEFLRRIKDMYPDTLRIVMSGYADVETVTQAVNEGAIYKFMTKPWDEKCLRDSITDGFRQQTKSRQQSATKDFALPDVLMGVAT